MQIWHWNMTRKEEAVSYEEEQGLVTYFLHLPEQAHMAGMANDIETNSKATSYSSIIYSMQAINSTS